MIHRKHDEQIDIYIQKPHENNTGFVNFGWEKTKPDFQELANRRNYVIIHFVTKGSGYFLVNGQYYLLSAGTMFVIYPFVPVSYGNTDPTDPMTFAWFGFRGSELTGLMDRTTLSADHPVAAFDRCDKIAQYIYDESMRVMESGLTNGIDTIGHMYICFGTLLRHSGNTCDAAVTSLPTDERIRNIVSFINSHYSQNINVADLCQIYHFSHATLWRAFKSSMSCSPTEYITRVRIHSARRFLSAGMSVQDTAAAVGWPDPFYFSHVFKQHTGLSPRDFALSAQHKE